MEVEDKSLIFTFNKNALFNFKQIVRIVLYHSGQKSSKRKKRGHVTSKAMHFFEGWDISDE
jgi:hypothetical protein